MSNQKINNIILATCQWYQMTPQEIFSRCRKAEPRTARQLICWFLARQGMTAYEISREIHTPGFNNSTVRHSIKTIDNDLSYSGCLRRDRDSITAILEGQV
jgi:chromosomal replication initiation ATPase DnaA